MCWLSRVALYSLIMRRSISGASVRERFSADTDLVGDAVQDRRGCRRHRSTLQRCEQADCSTEVLLHRFHEYHYLQGDLQRRAVIRQNCCTVCTAHAGGALEVPLIAKQMARWMGGAWLGIHGTGRLGGGVPTERGVAHRDHALHRCPKPCKIQRRCQVGVHTPGGSDATQSHHTPRGAMPLEATNSELARSVLG